MLDKWLPLSDNNNNNSNKYYYYYQYIYIYIDRERYIYIYIYIHIYVIGGEGLAVRAVEGRHQGVGDGRVGLQDGAHLEQYY